MHTHTYICTYIHVCVNMYLHPTDECFVKHL